MDEKEIAELVGGPRTVAVVGLSDKPDRPSYDVASFLQAQGWKIVPVNPMIKVWKGMACYPSLREIPDVGVDIVDIFRKSEDVPAVVEDALARWPQGYGKNGKARVIWMQLGIVNEEAAKKAEEKGWKVVQNRCLKIECGKQKKSEE